MRQPRSDVARNRRLLVEAAIESSSTRCDRSSRRPPGVAPQLWQRHLVLVLDALRAQAASPLPPAPADSEARLRMTDAVRRQ